MSLCCGVRGRGCWLLPGMALSQPGWPSDAALACCCGACPTLSCPALPGDCRHWNFAGCGGPHCEGGCQCSRSARPGDGARCPAFIIVRQPRWHKTGPCCRAASRTGNSSTGSGSTGHGLGAGSSNGNRSSSSSSSCRSGGNSSTGRSLRIGYSFYRQRHQARGQWGANLCCTVAAGTTCGAPSPGRPSCRRS